LEANLQYLQDAIGAEQDPIRREQIQQHYELFVTLLELLLEQQSKQFWKET